MSETLPFDIPGYRGQGLAGRGGMGRVYRAEQLATHRPVAIKLLSGGGVGSERLAGFRREAATLAGLEHPHIVPLYDYGERDGVPYLVVRYLSGGTIADRLDDGPIEIGQTVRWITDVADALDAAHRRGVTHRDVKPSNMLLDETGNVYLGDFGIAATAVDLAAAPHSGSAAYASPEQARGEAADARSDVYSLAVTAFEMLTGQKPYQAETALGMMVRHMHDPVPSAREVSPGLSPAIDSALAAGMTKAPEARPQSAGAFARLLASAAAAEPAEVGATLVAPPARKSSRVLGIAVALVAVIGCLAVLGVVGGGLGALLATREEATPTIRPTFAATVPPPTVDVPDVVVPFSDDFSSPSSGFAVTDPTTETDGQVRYAGEVLEITEWTPGIEMFSWREGLDEQDVQVAAAATMLAGPAGGSEVGIACRFLNQDNHVAASVRPDGNVSLWKRTDGVVERWQDWTPALPASVPGQVRQLQLRCAGNDVRFLVDGVEVAAATDPDPASGSLALFVGLLQADAPSASAAFDDLSAARP